MNEMTEQERNPELTYCEGGLHTITGICKDVNETLSVYTIVSDDNVKYNIRINLPTGYEMYPEQHYPKLNERCVVKAEQLHYNDGYYDGYSEHAYLPQSAEHEVELVNSHSYAIVNVS